MCGVCLTSSPANEDGIAASHAPVPTEPEVRAARLEKWLVDAKHTLTRDKKRAIRRQIRGIRKTITRSKYVPDPKLKGGRG